MKRTPVRSGRKPNLRNQSSHRRSSRPHGLRARQFFRPLLEQFEDRRLLATVTVNTTSDVSDGTTSSIAALLTAPGADGVISLREAIIAANNSANVDGPDADSAPDPDFIHFNIPGGGVKTITPATALPAITQAAVIDGYTQPGATPNTLAVGSDAVLLVELVGGVGPGNGLVISADNSTVRGLVINRFGSAAIHVQSGGNTIEGNWLGIEDDGNTRRANEYDVFVGNSPTSANNLIGGTTPAARNVMAGTANQNAGIMLFHGGGSATIQGNYIGMNAQGTDGIGANGRIYLGTPGNLVGGTAPGAGNVISGRAMDVFASGNTVQGNTFGLNSSGTATLANNVNGIIIYSNSIPTDNNLIGGTTPEARNVFATSSTAIDISNSSGPNVGNRVQGNYFGTNVAGTAPVGTPGVSGTAIRLNGAQNSLIGGTALGAGNVIANYPNGWGIEVLGSNNTIQGNRIGTNAAGTAAIPNGAGIFINNYITNTLIGGSTPGAGNLISGNLGNGILISPAGTFNTIQGNLIGVAADGVTPLGNGTTGGVANRNGIRVEGSDNLIGGTQAGEGNTIANHGGAGVLIPLTFVLPNAYLRNSILGNSIHSNTGLGIDIFGGGVTVNDLNDPDSGPNDVQNFPVITSATTSGATTTIQGTLNSTPSSTFRVELFASFAADGSGFGEGQTYLGFATVTTNASGNGSFSFTPAVPVPVGQFITGTATSSNGSTSELSAVRVVVVPPNQPPTITSNGGGDTASVSVPENTTAVTTVTATDPDTGTTLTYAITGGADASRFTINTTTGALAFVTAPNFEVPTDADTNDSYVVIVQASDGSLADLQSLTVTVTNVNEPPVVNIGPDSVINNFAAFARIGSFADPDADTWTATVNYGDGGGNQPLTLNADKTFALNYSYLNEGTYNVTVTVTDGSAAIGTDSLVVTVNRFTVDTTADNALTDGLLTLREAIANANFNADLNTIRFNIPTADAGHVYYRDNGVAGSVSIANITATTAATDSAIGDIDPDWLHSWWRIRPTSFVGNITRAAVIDGYTQPGATANTNGALLGSDAVLRVELNGGLAGPTGALGNDTASAGLGSIGIKGLVIDDWQLEGIYISAVTGGHVIAGNFVGVDVSGTLDRGNGRSGVFLTSNNSIIGGTTPADRNIISGNNLNAGIAVNSQSWTGDNRVQGNFIGLGRDGVTAIGNVGSGLVVGDINTTVGGTTAGASNVISNNTFAGISVGGFGLDVLIQGNYIGTDVTGTLDRGNSADGVNFTSFSGASRCTIGGTSAGAGNLISGNQASGISLGNTAQFVTVQGNFIGTDRTGTQALGNSQRGITVSGNSTNRDQLIGGTTPGAGNLISGNALGGIFIDVANEGTSQILGNRIGTDVTGSLPLGNGFDGILLENSTRHNTIGGTAAGDGNVIAFNGRNGIALRGTIATTGHSIRGNSIHSNGALGIDLSGGTTIPNGVTPNDPGDADTNATIANAGQNFPVIATAASFGGATTVQGTLSSTANTTFLIDFYSNPAADPTGFGEGQTYLGMTSVTTDASGNAPFVVSLPTAVPVGQYVTATATDQGLYDHDSNAGTPTIPRNNTSEFSGDRQVVAANQSPMITSNGAGDSASVSVPENTTAVTTVTALDPDVGTMLTYSIAGGADAGSFSINPTSGAVSFVTAPNFEAPTDADANNSYLVIVQASDGSLTDSQTLTVNVTNTNEPPVITSNGGGDSASINVLENTTAVTTVVASDPDAGTTLTYTISGGADASQFAINMSSGALMFITAPNFEAPTDAGADNSYDVIVTASDGSSSDSQTLTVTVTNANESPVITSNGGGDAASVSVAENTTAVTTVTATDPDAGTTLTYSISGGADAARFAINPSTGAVSFITAPNFEAPADVGADNAYEVVVAASDGGLTDAQALTVTVTNANESPVITSNGGGDSASVSVTENTTAVTTVTATDPDVGTSLVYSISGGADAGKFSINPTTGALSFVTAPDLESPTDADANNSYLVTVQVSDGNLSDAQALTVTVTNTNEPPVITSNGGGDAASVGVPENTTTVTTVAAIDTDAGTTLVYSISSGADAAQFAINPATGVLTFITAPNFEVPTDADSNNTYLVNVQASDGSLSDLQTLTVTVTNLNELPVITSDGGGLTASLSVPENTTAVTTVTATDPDAATTLTYSISAGADATKFTINPTTGVLTFVTAPNFESPTDAGANNVYDLIVEASDGSLLDRQAISVTVTDVVEAGYTISGQVYQDVTGNGKSADDVTWSLSPVTLKLYRDVNGDGVYQTSDTFIASTLTVSGGVYSFPAATTGKYIVKEVVPNDFVRTFPVLKDYVAVNLTAATPISSGNDWYNAETCDDCALSNVTYIVDHGGVLKTVTDLRGNTFEGDIVTANFTLTAAHQFTLVTYNAPGPAWDPNTAGQQTVFDFHTATFAPGSHSLTVAIPKNFYQIDFVCGAYINQLGPAGSNIFYSAQNRLISADNSGVNALGAPAIDLALSTTVDDTSPLLGSNVVITVQVSNAAGWSTATGVRVKDALPSGLTFVSAAATQGTYNSSSGEWSLVNPLNSGATATLSITATVATAGEKRNAAQVTAAGAPDIDSTPNNDSSPNTPRNEDDDDSVSIVPQLWTKYFVVNDSSSGSTREKTFEYAADGSSVENYQLNSGNTAPRGAATTAAGNNVWVIDANKMVYVYDASGTLLGSWSAGGLASNATPEGIATNGTDIWIVDAQQDKVFKFTNAASRTSGSQSAASSFALNSGNKNPKDIVASSTHLWVVDDSSTDKVFKYTLAGACLGSWTISGGGGSPTGITLDPANVNHLWIVDKSTDRVSQFNAATSRTSGSQSAASFFQLGSGNSSPEGIADPPPATKQVAANTPAASITQPSSARAFDVALLAVIDEINGLAGNGKKKRQ